MKLELKIILLIFFAIYSCKQNVSDSIKMPRTKVSDLQIEPYSTFNHVEHIRKNSIVGQIDGKQHEPKYFIDFIIQHQLEKPEHTKYLTDRKLLRKPKIQFCSENSLVIKDTLQNGKICEIKLEAERFKKELHIVKYRENQKVNKDYDLIDGKIPYGGFFGEIQRELKSVRFKLDDKIVEIGNELLPSINEPIFCSPSLLPNGIEAYEHGDNIYVYISGGNAADTYFGKLVFNDSGFVTSIMVDYVPLSMYRSFSPQFIGY